MPASLPPVMGNPRPGRASELAIVLAAGALLTVVLTYPIAFEIDRLARVNTDDGRWSIWVVAWVANALTTRPWSVFDANIFYPERLTLAYSEANLLAGALGAPVWRLTRNPYTTYNAVFLASFVLSFVAMYYLVRYLYGSRATAAIAAVLFAFCPFVFARTAHVQLLFIGTLPLTLLQFHRFVDRPTLWRAVFLGVALWITALGCGYYGIFAALMVGIGVLWFGVSRRLTLQRSYWTGIGIAAFVSIGLTLPFFLPYVATHQRGFERTLRDASMFSANLSAFAASASWLHRLWLPYIGSYNEVLFPGVLATLLGLAGVWTLRRRVASPERREIGGYYLVVGLFGFWLALGPAAGLYSVLYDWIPAFSFLRAPARAGIMVTLALSMLAALVIRDMLARSSRRGVMAAALALLAAGDLARMPLTQFRPLGPQPVAYEVLASLPRGPVAAFPYWYQPWELPRHAEYMLASTTHWQPLVNGYSDFIPPRFRETMRQLSSFPSEDALWLLTELGTRYLAIHTLLYAEEDLAGLRQRLEQFGGRLQPLVTEDPVWLFELVP